MCKTASLKALHLIRNCSISQVYFSTMLGHGTLTMLYNAVNLFKQNLEIEESQSLI